MHLLNQFDNYKKTAILFGKALNSQNQKVHSKLNGIYHSDTVLFSAHGQEQQFTERYPNIFQRDAKLRTFFNSQKITERNYREVLVRTLRSDKRTNGDYWFRFAAGLRRWGVSDVSWNVGQYILETLLQHNAGTRNLTSDIQLEWGLLEKQRGNFPRALEHLKLSYQDLEGLSDERVALLLTSWPMVLRALGNGLKTEMVQELAAAMDTHGSILNRYTVSPAGDVIEKPISPVETELIEEEPDDKVIVVEEDERVAEAELEANTVKGSDQERELPDGVDLEGIVETDAEPEELHELGEHYLRLAQAGTGDVDQHYIKAWECGAQINDPNLQVRAWLGLGSRYMEPVNEQEISKITDPIARHKYALYCFEQAELTVANTGDDLHLIGKNIRDEVRKSLYRARQVLFDSGDLTVGFEDEFRNSEEGQALKAFLDERRITTQNHQKVLQGEKFTPESNSKESWYQLAVALRHTQYPERFLPVSKNIFLTLANRLSLFDAAQQGELYLEWGIVESRLGDLKSARSRFQSASKKIAALMKASPEKVVLLHLEWGDVLSDRPQEQKSHFQEALEIAEARHYDGLADEARQRLSSINTD